MPGSIMMRLRYTLRVQQKIRIGIKKFSLHVHPYVAAYINKGFPSLKHRWQLKYSIGIKIVSSEKLAFLQYEFYDRNGQYIDMKEEIENQ